MKKNQEFALYVSQYGDRFYARTLKELRMKIPGRCSIMYDDRDGRTYRIGYVIGSFWLTKYEPCRKLAMT